MNGKLLLKKVLVIHKERVLCDMKMLSEDIYDADVPTTSVIIGNNGAGKSFILMIIAEIFYVLDNLQYIGNLKYGYYELDYKIDSDAIKIIIKDSKVYMECNSIEIQIDKNSLPQRVLGVSYMLNDKFRYKRIDDKIYQYLGIKQTSNASFTSSIENKISDSLINILSKGEFDFITDNMSEFLGIEPRISFVVEAKTKTFFSRKKTSNDLRTKANNEKSGNYRYDKIKKLEDKDFDEMIEILDNIRVNKLYATEDKKTTFEFTITNNDDEAFVKRINQIYNVIKKLNALGYIKNISLYLYKNSEIFSFEQASSGEKHFLYEMVSILDCIKEKSLVLVDEPEISMHPNWQMKYISTLKKIMKNYYSCHFVIASHSHYIVSDLDPNSSSLVIVNYDYKTKERNAELVPYSTYAWSAENVLYNVFNVRTSRNWYFEQDLREIVELIETQSKDIDKINNLIKKLKKYQLPDNDPLIELINEGKRYVDVLR